MYMNPPWLAYLLETLIEHTLSEQYPNDYTMHDLGIHFPNATEHPDGRDEYTPVEECVNILIMGLAIFHSLKYGENTNSGSVWSSLGGDGMSLDPRASAFGLSSLETRDEGRRLDDRWGGSNKGDEQARKWLHKSYKLWRQ